MDPTRDTETGAERPRGSTDPADAGARTDPARSAGARGLAADKDAAARTALDAGAIRSEVRALASGPNRDRPGESAQLVVDAINGTSKAGALSPREQAWLVDQSLDRALGLAGSAREREARLTQPDAAFLHELARRSTSDGDAARVVANALSGRAARAQQASEAAAGAGAKGLPAREAAAEHAAILASATSEIAVRQPASFQSAVGSLTPADAGAFGRALALDGAGLGAVPGIGGAPAIDVRTQAAVAALHALNGGAATPGSAAFVDAIHSTVGAEALRQSKRGGTDLAPALGEAIGRHWFKDDPARARDQAERLRGIFGTEQGQQLLLNDDLPPELRAVALAAVADASPPLRKDDLTGTRDVFEAPRVRELLAHPSTADLWFNGLDARALERNPGLAQVAASAIARSWHPGEDAASRAKQASEAARLGGIFESKQGRTLLFSDRLLPAQRAQHLDLVHQNASWDEATFQKKRSAYAVPEIASALAERSFQSYLQLSDAPRALPPAQLDKALQAANATNPDIKKNILALGGATPQVTALPIQYASDKTGAVDFTLWRVQDKATGADRFVDHQGRRYGSFDEWRKENKLPPGTVVFPTDGHLRTDARGQVVREAHNTAQTRDTAKEHLFSAVERGVLVGGTVAGIALIAGTGGAAAPAGAFTLGPLTAATGTQFALQAATFSAATFGAGKATSGLLDRSAHGQSLSLRNAEARALWLGLSSSSLSATGIGTHWLARGSALSVVTNRAAQAADNIAFADSSLALVKNPPSGGDLLFAALGTAGKAVAGDLARRRAGAAPRVREAGSADDADAPTDSTRVPKRGLTPSGVGGALPADEQRTLDSITQSRGYRALKPEDQAEVLRRLAGANPIAGNQRQTTADQLAALEQLRRANGAPLSDHVLARHILASARVQRQVADFVPVQLGAPAPHRAEPATLVDHTFGIEQHAVGLRAARTDLAIDGRTVTFYESSRNRTADPNHVTVTQAIDAFVRLPKSRRDSITAVNLDSGDATLAGASGYAYSDQPGVVHVRAVERGAQGPTHQLAALFNHEGGHLETYVKLGTDPAAPAWQAYARARDLDRATPSGYARTDVFEDSAEALALYRSSDDALRDEYRKLFPHRFALFDTLDRQGALDDLSPAALAPAGRVAARPLSRSTILGRGYPLGFDDLESFRGFSAQAHRELTSVGIRDAELVLDGSAVTGRSAETGRAFDDGRRSDFDLALASPQLVERARALGIPLKADTAGNTRSKFALDDGQLERLGLAALRQRLAARAGRPVNVLLVDDAAAARQFGLVLPR